MLELSQEKAAIIDAVLHLTYFDYCEMKEERKIEDDDKEGMAWLRRFASVRAEEHLKLHYVTKDEINAFMWRTIPMDDALHLTINLPQVYYPKEELNGKTEM